MKLTTCKDLFKLKNTLTMFGGEIPDNMVIISPEIIQEAEEWAGVDNSVIKDATGVTIYGIRVIRDYAEVVDITEQP